MYISQRCFKVCSTRCLRIYDVVIGNGEEPVVGDRVAVHYDVKYR